ncbi:hypothetical protein F8M41_008931 [Gigaspora margarita]|uniref:Uncharacterized protein n=1 Tax=Gigaspora margarita TaxID=4874 RepID=A0A8H3X4B7_GIGMA|nr:hypothetical protein F8M41_008931 [Gigaspora margarita]
MKEIELEFSFEGEIWNIPGDGLTIREVLIELGCVQFTKDLQKLNVFYINQLIDQNGINLLSWQQLKAVRNVSNRGRTMKWFRTIEKTTLIGQESRQIKDNFRVKAPNQRTPCLATTRVSEDRRQKE